MSATFLVHIALDKWKNGYVAREQLLHIKAVQYIYTSAIVKAWLYARGLESGLSVTSLKETKTNDYSHNVYITETCMHAQNMPFRLFVTVMTGFAHTELKEVNKCHFLTTKGP